MSNLKIIRIQDLADRLSVSRQTIWRLSKKDPNFPPKVRLTGQCVGFREDAVEAWLDSRTESSTEEVAA
ncbi:helix-turn-helix transcriptional regulator [Gracilimonas sp.]|uniref:helix-turn-helix transcriptional regulator n=1 Tax=Gracilimonas sp. TaxID=1974203 RepID=UPI0028718D90|nr:AlpA family phage regulatory protein [Gracilimonas sp.]